MGKKERPPRDAGAATPKRLRKQLRKAEAQLDRATAKRDRVEARVQALSIIADEIRAQLSEAERIGTPSRQADPVGTAAIEEKGAAGQAAARTTAPGRASTSRRAAPAKPRTGSSQGGAAAAPKAAADTKTRSPSRRSA